MKCPNAGAGPGVLRRFDEHRQRADAPERVRSEAGHLDIRLPVSSGTWIPIARSEGRRSPGVHVCPATMRRRSPEARRSYASEDFTNDGRGYDIVFDAVGKSSFRRCRRLLERHGVFLFTDLGFLWHVPILALLTRFIGQEESHPPDPQARPARYPVPQGPHRSRSLHRGDRQALPAGSDRRGVPVRRHRPEGRKRRHHRRLTAAGDTRCGASRTLAASW
jgi:hypothetical protein